MKHKKKENDFFNEPSEVLFLKMAAHFGIPIGLSTYEKTIEKYPDYFPDEYARKKKWEAIPKEVHDAKFKEYWEFHEKLWKDEPKSGGIMSMINNPEEYQKWNEAYQRLSPIEEAKEKELRKKYYAQYGF